MGSWRFDLEAGVSSWSAEAFRLFGVDPASPAPSGESFLALIHRDDREAMASWIASSAGGSSPPPLTFRVALPEDGLRILRGHGEVVRTPTGAVGAIAGVVQDVTFEHLAHVARAESEVRYKQLFDDAKECIVRVRLDGTIVAANLSFVQLMGYASECELVGRPARGLHASQEQHDAARVAASAGRPVERVTLHLRARTGASVFLEASGVPVSGGLGEPDCFQWYGVDVTEERARAAREKGLLDQVEKLELVLDATQLGFWTWNPATGVVSVDSRWAEMVGYRADEVSHHVEAIMDVHPDDRARLRQSVERFLEGGEARFTGTYRVQHRSGHWVDILNQAKVFERDESGRPTRVCGTRMDITAQRNDQRAAVEANRAKTNFLATISHELRTPLTAILGLSEVVARGIYGPLTPKQEQSLTTIHQSGRHLLALVNDVLDTARIEAGEMRIDCVAVPVDPLVRECAACFAESARAKEQELEVDVTPAVGAVWGDPKRLRQVVLNLLANALKFSPEGARVGVGARQLEGGGRIELWVRDSGPGIPAEDRERIFEPFVQLDSGLSRTGAGVGLGLSLVKRIVELHGGMIEVRDGLEGGVTFAVMLAPAGTAQIPVPLGDHPRVEAPL